MVNSNLFTTPIGRFRIIGFIEGLSFLVLLFIAMPLKYMAHMPELNRITGVLHGLLFVLFILGMINAAVTYNWSFRRHIGPMLLASIIPFGTFYIDRKILKPMMSSGK